MTQSALRLGMLPLLLAAALVATWSRAEDRPAPKVPERVLLVLIDAVRPDRLGAHGYARETSPTFDRLASAGVLFDDCRSTSTWTKPALASLFSGVGPMIHGVEKGGMSDSLARRVPALSDRIETLPETFQRNGYATIAFTGNPHVAAETGLAQGFDRVVRTSQFGPGLADNVIEWLEMPVSPDGESVRRLSSNDHNLLGDWGSEAAGGDVEVSATGDRARLATRQPTAGRVCESLSLGEVPAGDESFVFGISYAVSRGASLTVTDGSGKLVQPRRIATPDGAEGVLLERLSGSAGELSLNVCFAAPAAEIEVSGLVLLPSQTLGKLRDDRWFAYLHLMNPHLPFRASQPHLDAFPVDRYGVEPIPLSAAAAASLGRQTIPGADDVRVYQSHYDASIHEADAMLGRVIAALERLGLLAGTAVIVTSDHGEALMERGLMNHGGTPYEEVLRVPLLFYAPRGLASGVRVSSPVSLVDVYPTLTDLLGLETEQVMSGTSLVPFMSGQAPTMVGRDFVTTHTPMGKGSSKRTDVVIRDGVKLMVTEFENGGEKIELYDLREDPGETKNLAEGRDDEVRRLRGALAAERARQELLRQQMECDPANHILGETAEQQLKGLGYL